ncbi:hypothetical protein [Nocardia cyriacigeorgica]|uniref:hypothetical protein n=1 Tax=Nocardia cyriacigeorgica TaxID=135487 RepID=UPI002454C375|nr:hypothetical protein [Nocardia cyriacigeorgica]
MALTTEQKKAILAEYGLAWCQTGPDLFFLWTLGDLTTTLIPQVEARKLRQKYWKA